MKPASFIYALDLFKSPLFLKINHRAMTATTVGVCLSLIIYALLGYFFSQSDFFLKLQPTVVTDSSSLTYSPLIEYSNRPFAFAIKDLNNKNYIDPTIFSFMVKSVSTTTQPNVTGYSMIVEDERSYHYCTPNDALRPEDYPVLENSFCLDENNFTLVGSDSENQCTNFQLHVIMCSNSTDNNNSCQSQDEIDNFFNMKNLNLMYVNTVFQTKNYETPITTKLTATLYKLDAKLSRLVTVNFQKATMITDETLILPVKNSFETFLYETEKSEYGMQVGGIPILSILIYSSSDQITINRSYQSLPEAFAVLGGLLSILTVTGRFLLNLYHSLYITTLLMNFLYSFQPAPNAVNELTLIEMFSNRIHKTKSREITDVSPLALPPMSMETQQPILNKPSRKHRMSIQLMKIPEKQLKEESLPSMSHEEIKIQNIKPTHSNSHNSEPQINFQKEVDICESSLKKNETSQISSITPRKSSIFRSFLNGRTFLKKQEKDTKSAENFLKLNEKKSKINFNFWDYLKLKGKKFFLREPTFKDKLFERAQEVFENEIDIVKILQKLQDIEKLKHLLLSDQQIVLFNLMEKPMIFLPENIRSSRKSLLMELSPQQIPMKSQMNEAFSYYQELENKDVLDPVDNKLFGMVGRRIKAYKKYYQNS